MPDTTTARTSPDLEEICRVTDAATPGPWGAYWGDHIGRGVDATDYGAVRVIQDVAEIPSDRCEWEREEAVEVPSEADAEFIAKARQWVPALAAEVERLSDRVNELEAERPGFDRDPAALAWARSKVQRQVDKLRDWERQAAEQGKADQSMSWRRIANHLARTFVGGEGCVIAAFDHRRPELPEIGPAVGNTGRTRG